MTKAKLLSVWVTWALISVAAAAAAQPIDPPVAPDATESEKVAGRIEFDRGIELFREERWSDALSAFHASIAAYPTRAAYKNGGLCLRRLGRYGEAVEMYRTLLQAFPDLPEADRVVAETALADLAGRVGEIQPLAIARQDRITVDGHPRTPGPDGAISVEAGARIVRVHRDGYLPFERVVEVRPGRRVPIAISPTALVASGRLRVLVADDRPATVIVDGQRLGEAPWEGLLRSGPHWVALSGEGSLGAAPHRAAVLEGQVTEIRIPLEVVDAILRIEVAPADASVVLDGVPLGRGAFEGRLPPGGHDLEVSASGFIVARRTVEIASREREIVRVQLVPVEAPGWSGVTLELGGGPALSPSLGGDAAESCGCDAGIAFGGMGLLHVAYQFEPGIAVGVVGGYAALFQTLSARATVVTPNGLDANPGEATDELSLVGPLVGAAIAAHVGDRFPITFRVSAGALFGSFRDGRSGRFTSSDGTSYELGDVPEAQDGELELGGGTTYLAAMPEIRAGVRLDDRFVLSLGLTGALLAAPSVPTWPESARVTTPVDGLAGLPDRELAGTTLLLVVPSLALHVRAF